VPDISMRSALRIAVVTETYPPEINGVANTMRHLVSGLEGRGHQVHVIRPRQRADAATGGERRSGETLVPGLPVPGYRGLRFGLPVFRRLGRLWRDQAPDLVYIATQGPLGRAALSTAHAAGIPTLTGFHTEFQEYSQHYGLGLLRDPIARSLRRFHNRSDATLVPTEALRDRLTDQGFINVRVFGRGVDTALFSPARRRAELRAQWGCGPDDPALLYVGRLAPEKNIELVLETFSRVQTALPTARCVLIGDGPERSRLTRAFPQCRFAGAKVGTELAEHYASGDLFVFPSLTETFGNVVPEAMASGLAVVAFDYAAARSYIRSGDNGIAVAPGDREAFVAAALGAARDIDCLRRYGTNARTAAEALGWDRAIDAVERSMLEVVHRRGARPESGIG
jgi:glycosyltransferase involved in cell wall biosynthesis